MGPIISEQDQKTIEDLLAGKRELPDMSKRSKTISIGSKVHPLGYRISLYGIVTKFKKGKVEVSFTHLKEAGNKATKKWFNVKDICLFEDRTEVYAKIEENVKSQGNNG